ncbi:MAG: M55 family metallopeptidase [Lentisphaeria bacterium]|nr:M55 family metallopeptidase [Lentisphaeria bacterium]
MKILIITDIEGVNSVLDFPAWCHPAGKYYLQGCHFLTEEVNAVVDGFLEADGQADILVWDGHGEGAVEAGFFHPGASLQKGAPFWPDFGEGFDVLAFVGQHAKAGAVGGHLAHTQTGEAIDFRINGVSLGEFGQLVYAMAERGSSPVFASGDLALTREAEALCPAIYTVAVKEGLNKALPEDIETEKIFANEAAAIHYPRAKVLAELKKKAFDSLVSYKKEPEKFAFKLPEGPFAAEAEYRRCGIRNEKSFGKLPARKIRTDFHLSVIAAIREFYKWEWQFPDGKYSVSMEKE